MVYPTKGDSLSNKTIGLLPPDYYLSEFTIFWFFLDFKKTSKPPLFFTHEEL